MGCTSYHRRRPYSHRAIARKGPHNIQQAIWGIITGKPARHCGQYISLGQFSGSHVLTGPGLRCRHGFGGQPRGGGDRFR